MEKVLLNFPSSFMQRIVFPLNDILPMGMAI